MKLAVVLCFALLAACQQTAVTPAVSPSPTRPPIPLSSPAHQPTASPMPAGTPASTCPPIWKVYSASAPSAYCPTPSPTPSPAASASAVPTSTPTASPEPLRTSSPTPSASPTPQATATPVATATPSPTPTSTPTATPTVAPTAEPSPIATATPSPTPSAAAHPNSLLTAVYGTSASVALALSYSPPALPGVFLEADIVSAGTASSAITPLYVLPGGGYRRAFTACSIHGKPIGACAAVVNPTAGAISVPNGLLEHSVVFHKDGTATLDGPQCTSLPALSVCFQVP